MAMAPRWTCPGTHPPTPALPAAAVYPCPGRAARAVVPRTTARAARAAGRDAVADHIPAGVYSLIRRACTRRSASATDEAPATASATDEAPAGAGAAPATASATAEAPAHMAASTDDEGLAASAAAAPAAAASAGGLRPPPRAR